MDFTKVSFSLRSPSQSELLLKVLRESGIGDQVEMYNGTCSLRVPPFDWRTSQELTPLDDVFRRFGVEGLTSQSWKVRVCQFKHSGIKITQLIEQMVARKASDLHLRAGALPYFRIDGDLTRLQDALPLTATDIENFIVELGGKDEMKELETQQESSFQYYSAGLGYLRVSGYYKRSAPALAIRFIPEEPYPFDRLNLPDAVRQIANTRRGLFLVCGITGSGKSTTLASLIDLINETRPAHILTIEDPVEFVYHDKKSVISQREVGRDTTSFENALRGALREDPDVILIGEMRDADTIRAALSAAETGHLVMSTLHTMTAVDTVNRIISYFPQAERDLIRQELAYSLRGVLCQRLLKHKSGGRIPCVEFLLGGRPIVRDAIVEGDLDRLHRIMELDSEMKSFDQHAVELYELGKVTKEEAISACSDEEAFKRVITGIKSTAGKILEG